MSLNELASSREGRGKEIGKISKQGRKKLTSIPPINNKKGESKWKNCLGQ
jgi:hypothetical protein